MSMSWLSFPTAAQSKSGHPILDNIHIAAPCPAEWEKMLGDNRVRHCCKCNLNVYNISEMTRTEAEQLIRSHEGRLCVRFYRRADGTILTKNCPVGLRATLRRVSRFGATILAATMSVGSALAQNTAKSTTQSRAEENEASSGLDLTVFDPTGALISNAKVILCQCKNHSTISLNTDATGVAHFVGLRAGAYSMEIQAPGFKTNRQNLKLRLKKIEQLQVKLKVAPASVTVDVAAAPVVVADQWE